MNMNRQYNNRGRDQFNFETVHGSVVVQNREPPTRPRFELLLLQQVEREVASRLEQSLHNKVFIVLGKQEQPEQVKRLWDAEVKIGSKPPEPLLPQTSILEVFERPEIAGQLLILGAPGAGKTTTMLDLAQSLIDKAIQDSSYPIPVLFNLSSWKDPRLLISTWLVEELKSKYGVRKDIGKKLIEEKQLLPMLDGLDEVKPEHQESCVDSINQWLQGDYRPLSIVVCSRREEYANYKTHLHLNGAIVLQELTDEQIQDYLSKVKRFDLCQLLQQDTVLLELVKTPLLLSITVLSYEELSLQRWQQLTSTKQRIKMLFGAYGQMMLHREIESKAYRKLTPPTAIQTQRWLIFLAQQLQRESQTEFLIEKIQLSWLVTGKRKKAYQWTASLIYGLCGLIGGVILGVFLGLLDGLIAGLHHGLIYGLNSAQGLGFTYALTFGIAFWLVELINKQEQEIKLDESFSWHWSFKEAKKSSILGLITGLIFSIFFWLTFLFLILVITLSEMQINSINDVFEVLIFLLIVWVIFALFFGLIGALIGGLIGGIAGAEVNIKRIPNQGIWKSANKALFITLSSYLIIGLIFGLINWQQHGLVSGLVAGAGFGSFWGLTSGLSSAAGKATIRHLALRLTLYKNGSIPWNYARFLNYCTERCFLQRVGGRYRFIHKLLQDYFAEM